MSEQNESWTIKRLLEWTTDFFSKKGIETPRLEAEILLAAALNLKRIDLYIQYESEPGESTRAKYRDFVKRRGAGEPTAYLVGAKEFFSLSFIVNKSVLIPRPETEQLVLTTLDLLKKMPAGSNVALCDVGTGSGAIAVTLAKHWPKTLAAPNIVAVDLSPDALAVAKENAEKLKQIVNFVQSDLLEAVSGNFDIVVSNPPYVSESEYADLPISVRDFEPKTALLAGKTGTEVIERLIEQSKTRLKSGGNILIEISPMISDAVIRLFGSDWQNVRLIKDANGHNRIVAASKI